MQEFSGTWTSSVAPQLPNGVCMAAAPYATGPHTNAPVAFDVAPFGQAVADSAGVAGQVACGAPTTYDPAHWGQTMVDGGMAMIVGPSPGAFAVPVALAMADGTGSPSNGIAARFVPAPPGASAVQVSPGLVASAQAPNGATFVAFAPTDCAGAGGLPAGFGAMPMTPYDAASAQMMTAAAVPAGFVMVGPGQGSVSPAGSMPATFAAVPVGPPVTNAMGALPPQVPPPPQGPPGEITGAPSETPVQPMVQAFAAGPLGAMMQDGGATAMGAMTQAFAAVPIVPATPGTVPRGFVAVAVGPASQDANAAAAGHMSQAFAAIPGGGALQGVSPLPPGAYPYTMAAPMAAQPLQGMAFAAPAGAAWQGMSPVDMAPAPPAGVMGMCCGHPGDLGMQAVQVQMVMQQTAQQQQQQQPQQQTQHTPQLPTQMQASAPQTAEAQPQQPRSGCASNATLQRRLRRQRAARLARASAACYTAGLQPFGVAAEVPEVRRPAPPAAGETALEAEADVCAALMRDLEANETSHAMAVERLQGTVLRWSFHPAGCRVIQTALESTSNDVACALASELRGNVRRASESKHANFVLGKAVEVLPAEKSAFIAEELRNCAWSAIRHQYGCRIFCRLIEHAGEHPATARLIDQEVAHMAHELSRHEYAHYVVAHVLEHGLAEQKTAVVGSLLSGHLARLAQNRYGRFVVETLFTHCSAEDQSEALKLLRRGADPVNLATHSHGRMAITAALRSSAESGSMAGEVASLASTLMAAAPQLSGTKFGHRVLQAAERRCASLVRHSPAMAVTAA